MQRLFISLSLVCIVGLIFFVNAHTDSEHNHDEAICHEWIKDIKFEIDTIENGVTVKITSDKPDVVKMIQEHAAKEIFEFQETHPGGKYNQHSDEGLKERKSKHCPFKHKSGGCHH